MKKFKLPVTMMLIAIIASFSSCKKKGCMDPNSFTFNPEAKKDDGSCTTPEAVKKSLIFKKTATWCPYCGDWGTSYSTDITNAHANCQVIALHGDSEFESTLGDNIMDALPSSGWPHFFAGTEDISNSYYELNSAVNSELGKAVEVAMAIEKSPSASSINVRVQSQWLGSIDGEFYIAVYLLENGQIAEQQIAGSSADPNFVHNNVLRAEANNSPFGVPVTINGYGYLLDVNIDLSSSWVAANCYPVAVMWKKNGSSYDFINFVK